MQVAIYAVGKMKKEYLRQGVLDYSKRLSHYLSFTIQEVKESKISKNMGEEEKKTLKKEEGKRLLKGTFDDAYLIPLHEEGRFLTSKGLATSLSNLQRSGKLRIVFFIGGPLGLSSEVLERGDFILSLSPMTFPHQMARLVLVEQLYRASKIMAKEPYHY